MTTLIYIENVLGSGQTVKLTEDFDNYSVGRDLRPGEHVRLVISQFKSLSIEEVPIAGAGASRADHIQPIEIRTPRLLARRYG
jgi:hypothetical protein